MFLRQNDVARFHIGMKFKQTLVLDPMTLETGTIGNSQMRVADGSVWPKQNGIGSLKFGQWDFRKF